MDSQEDPLELTANNLVKEQTTQLQNHMIVVAWLLDHHFHIAMVDKYLHKQINIILKYFCQRNNNSSNFMGNPRKANMAVMVRNTVVLQLKHRFRQVNLRVEVLELNSGEKIKFNTKNQILIPR